MVVLEAAAITAGGVAAYKGGKAAVVATTKSVKKNMKLSSQEKDRKETYDSRKSERKERFAKINEYRSSLKDVNGGKSRGAGMAVPGFNWNKDKNATTTSSSRVAYSSTSRKYATNNSSSKSSSGNWW
eukprot:CAMPEP_0183717996 /NCGR_PEP_ID=MMETSP0737-20130205/11382_1 /TAXON_ID=385413 /ORGANISM="Thalassiosira miniscula, Strain CCMP1093" /LENGTH=127 /DNA_ID=CAMNT_0025947475 /DNA_START=300 /DNA_END=680 /DNA_ORIENTATION=+